MQDVPNRTVRNMRMAKRLSTLAAFAVVLAIGCSKRPEARSVNSAAREAERADSARAVNAAIDSLRLEDERDKWVVVTHFKERDGRLLRLAFRGEQSRDGTVLVWVARDGRVVTLSVY